jgi:hypothetical protein
MNSSIAAIYDYLLQQLAAESYFEDITLDNPDQVARALTLGTNRLGYPAKNPELNQGFPGYTRMTDSQAAEFLKKFAIVHQWSDNATLKGTRLDAEGRTDKPRLNADILANSGLSATLIQRRTESGAPLNEFTLAIRSTEFRSWSDGGDAERDKWGADIFSIAYTGFALAQQDALEQYYAWIKDNGKLPAGAKLDVVGYSLGGNLATVFTEMHRSDTDIRVGQTMTFNGAGRGTFDASQGTIGALVAYYHQVLIDPSGALATSIEDEAIRAAAIRVVGEQFDSKFL